MLTDKKIVVLGGTAGIGRAVAEGAAHEGAKVVVVSRSQKRVDAAVAAIPGSEGHAADLSSEPATEALFARIGSFDHLVYTAGEELFVAPLERLELAAARRFFEVRYWGALAAVKAARTRIARDGSIVLTSGTLARRPLSGMAVAASLCGAMESLMRALALELAPVRVNVVTPGFVETDLWAGIPEVERRAMFASAGAKLPVGRIGTPFDVAEHYLSFLRGRYVTGQTLVVDGGGLMV